MIAMMFGVGFDLIGDSIGYGALALIAIVLATWLLLLLISWLWYFCLDRIRELSTAIRARRDDDER
jgi:hypothetical protein